MYHLIKTIHSLVAYLFLTSVVLTIIYLIIAKILKKPFANRHRTMALIGLASGHIQVLFGIILYFISPLGFRNISSAALKDSISRLFFLEHPVTMILAVILITIGYSRSKSAQTDKKRMNTILIFYCIGLLLIISRIPWQIWP